MLVTVIHWRDIPSQIVSGKGRKKSKLMLSERFQEAIDMAAMRDKSHESDAYLEGWRKIQIDVEDSSIENLANRLEVDFDEGRLRSFVTNGGWEPK